MYKSKVVFILGAGSSYEVGLPVGKELKENIKRALSMRFDEFSRQLSGDAEIKHAMLNYAKAADPLLTRPERIFGSAAKLALALPHAASIDNVLDAHATDKNAEICGKLGIVKCILEAERSSSLYFDPLVGDSFNPEKSRNSWFPVFIETLFEGIQMEQLERLFENVSFINFNYDRCVEHYVLNAVMAYYHLDEINASRLLEGLQILRPYGVVGKLPWQSGSAAALPFGAEKPNLIAVVPQIKTFTEQNIDETALTEIRRSFQGAEIIAFLGSAYHRQNLDLLKPREECRARQVLGTAFGISASDAGIIQSHLEDCLGQGGRKADIRLRKDLGCRAFMDEFRRTLMA